MPPGDLDPEAVRTDHLSWVPLMGVLHLASPLSAFQATEELIIQEQMSSLAYLFKDCLLFSTFYFPQTVDGGALEGFCSDHAHFLLHIHAEIQSDVLDTDSESCILYPFCWI